MRATNQTPNNLDRRPLGRMAVDDRRRTLSETLPGVEVVNWYGAILPRGTPKEIVGRLHAGMIGAMNTPDVRARLAANGLDANGTTPEEFGSFRKAEEARWGRVIKQAGIKQQ